ncbi:hypothetical protein [Alicyclobacillus acidocaldarius]|uniref:hypothetical protein n=1 Tax=Alicyclobacillus acidocaldarius TaxID=405212 RepID=UPI0013050B00|nr:hypothetical protein [Alicyclobacillus acidocaldarius]
MEWNVFFEKLNQNADSLLHVGFDKEGTPFFVKARESGNYIYIECCSPHFNYAPRAVRADLRYNQEDQRVGRLYMMLIDVPIQHISKIGKTKNSASGKYRITQNMDLILFVTPSCVRHTSVLISEKGLSRQISSTRG